MKESGIRLSNIIELRGGGKGVGGLLKGSESTAKELSEKGWRLTLSDRDGTIITMGRGVSGLTGNVQVNLLKFGKILEIL